LKLIVAITGASGVNLAEKFIDNLPKNIEVFIIISKNAKTVFKKENNREVFYNDNIAASIASGSFKTDAMIVLPCSMNTLAKISCGISDNLITRTASVMIKEQRKLILAPRELPFSPIALENMLKLSKLSIIIAPPIMGYYSNPKNLEQMEDFVIGKWFDLLGIKHDLFKRWGEE
jgi:4-hydroxy-3-polyprenylbenzoate decarboxylase